MNIKEINEKIKTDLDIKNVHDLPKVEKVVINVGTGRIKDDKGAMEEVMRNLSLISGQRAVLTRAKKAIASFKIRENEAIGAMVTLRGTRMYSFIERLANVALPRIRDFRGLSRKMFDKNGNYTYPVREVSIFPEVPYDKITHNHGMQICFRITNSDPKKSRVLLKALGLPFEKITK